MSTVPIDISEYDMLRNGKEQAEAKGDWYIGNPDTVAVSESTQFTGFDDIEFEIREKLTKKVQEELDERLQSLETARKCYEEDRATLKPKFEKEKTDLIEKFKKEKAELKKDCSELELSLEEILEKREKIQANLDKIPNWIQRLFGVKLDS